MPTHMEIVLRAGIEDAAVLAGALLHDTKVVDPMRGTHQELEALFDAEYAKRP